MSEERYHYLFSKKSDRHDSCELRYSEESTWNKSTLRSRWDSNLQRGGCQVLQCNLNSQHTWVTISIGALTNEWAVMRAERLLEVKNKNRTPFRKQQSFAWLNKPKCSWDLWGKDPEMRGGACWRHGALKWSQGCLPGSKPCSLTPECSPSHLRFLLKGCFWFLILLTLQGKLRWFYSPFLLRSVPTILNNDGFAEQFSQVFART